MSSPTPSAAPAAKPLRPAATLVVMRDSPRGLETLLLRRGERNDQSSGAWVFPGGLLDAQDREAHRCCGGLAPHEADAALGMADGALDYFVAAVRECFEEAGLLLARAADGAIVPLHEEQSRHMGPWRGRLHRGEATITEFCEAFGLTLALDEIAYHTRWVTPAIRPKRWDTRFFFAIAPQGQESAHDEIELVEQLWLTPAEALARGDDLKLLNPTKTTLSMMARFASAAEVMAHVREPRTEALAMPRVADGPEGMMPVGPDHGAWAEVGKLDPQGHGHASYVITPGRPVRLSPRIIRVTAENPGMMTGPGTNTYLVGGGPNNRWVVIDPGPDLGPHLDAIRAALPGPLAGILVTHTHPDHSPAAATLARETGAPVMGRIATHPQNQDPSFAPSRVLDDGDRVAVDEGVTLRALHTPGHASNHLCYLLEEEALLFTGDHVMQASTVVIGPPDGDMAVYLASLRRLVGIGLRWLAPGHGFLMGSPDKVLEGIVAHRLKREAKVVSALEQLGAAEVDALLPVVYDDVRPALHPMARRSLTAHLLKLRTDGRAAQTGERWSLVTAT